MVQSNDTNLKELLDDISCGKIQLPEFQRNWTWDDNRIRGIIASVLLGYPMGAVMVLEYGNPDFAVRYRLVEGVIPPVPKNSECFKYEVACESWVSLKTPEKLILDGQQRLTSLYQALYSPNCVKTRTDTNKDIERYYYIFIDKCLDRNEDTIDSIISVPIDKRIKENFDRDILLDLSTTEDEYANKAFPLNIIFGSNLLNWIMGYMKFYNNNENAIQQLNIFKENVIDVITSYKLPVITLGRETNRESVCKVFENVNTGGVPLTVFELVTASFATYRHNEKYFNLREDWENCKKIIQGNDETLSTDIFNNIDETLFLTTVTLFTSYTEKVAGKSSSVSCKKKDVLRLKYDSYISNKEAVLLGFKLARKFLLQYQCVFRKRDLPYTTQVIPLAAICAVLGESRCGDPKVIAILSKWYWCGVLGEMYGGANETRYANDIEDVIDEINGKENKSRTINSAFFSSVRLLTLQTRNSAAYKGIMALIYKEHCRDFINNISIDVINSMVESPDIHHIFPEAYCRKSSITEDRYNSIVNKTPILLKTNRTIGGNAPSIYLNKILKNTNGLTLDVLRNRVESHLINFDLLYSDNFNAYFIDRAKKLLDIIELAMGKPVSDRAAENTIKRFGVTLESNNPVCLCIEK